MVSPAQVNCVWNTNPLPKMKPLHTFKWLALISTSAALTLATATADPGKDKKDKRNKSDHSEKKADKDFDKAERKAEKADNKFEKKMEKVEAREEKREARRVYKKGEFKDRFQDSDRERIVTYFSGYKSSDHGLPPGLAKRWKDGKRLPAGWRDRVVTGYVIEDEWYSAFEPVP